MIIWLGVVGFLLIAIISGLIFSLDIPRFFIVFKLQMDHLQNKNELEILGHIYKKTKNDKIRTLGKDIYLSIVKISKDFTRLHELSDHHDTVNIQSIIKKTRFLNEQKQELRRFLVSLSVDVSSSSEIDLDDLKDKIERYNYVKDKLKTMSLEELCI